MFVRLRGSTWILLAWLVLVGGVQAENWPGWRGPRGDGTCLEGALPVSWSATENVAWQVPVPGGGHASPIVWNDRIFTVTAVEETGARDLLCFQRSDGSLLWQTTVLTAPLEGKHPLNSYASSTPATDGEQVYVAFLDGEEMLVAAYDFAGREVWSARPGPFHSKHGFCSNPVLFEELVIVNGDHDGESFLVALDRESGETVWKIDRENKTRSYSTPIIRQFDGRTQLLLSGNMCVASYDPRDGRRHWIIDGPTEQFVASIVDHDGLLFMTCGFPEHHILCIRPDGYGNVTDTHVAWRTTRGASYVPSPIAAGGYFLVVSDGGVASCFEVQSGERVWMQRIGTHFSASPITAEGLVYFLSDEGVTTIIRPGPELEVVAENKLEERCFASPAASNGQLFIRTEESLFCIGPRE